MQVKTPIMMSSVRIGEKSQKTPLAVWGHKLMLLGIFALAYGVFYVYPNFNPLTQPRELPLLTLDRMTPFLPWTFTIYLSEFLLIAITIVLIKDLERFNSFARHAFGVLAIIGSIFFIFPTTYPRPVYAIEQNIVVAFAMNIIKNVDAPTNCFPSMHVAITYVTVYALRFLNRKVWFLFCLWGLAIIAATLTTKQHYVIDILAGAAVAHLVIFLEQLYVRRKFGRKAI